MIISSPPGKLCPALRHLLSSSSCGGGGGRRGVVSGSLNPTASIPQVAHWVPTREECPPAQEPVRSGQGFMFISEEMPSAGCGGCRRGRRSSREMTRKAMTYWLAAARRTATWVVLGAGCPALGFLAESGQHRVDWVWAMTSTQRTP